ncbi:MAG: inositol monophosphatase family protein [Gemmatimonadaceae bacterium]
MTTSSYMHAVAEVARAAGDRAQEYFATNLVIETKADGSPVTIADRSAEQLAREWIAERFSSDGIVGEEFGVDKSSAPRRWIIDPIDGTASFVRGVPLWGTLIAVAEANEVIAGAAYFPALAQIIVAGRGEGCWWNDQKCSVSTVAEMSAATVLGSGFIGDGPRANQWADLIRKAALFRTWGDCYGYFLVATGRAEVMVDPVVSEWDIAAFLPIIEESGGIITDWTGAHTAEGGNAIATNAALAREVRQILGANTEEDQRT